MPNNPTRPPSRYLLILSLAVLAWWIAWSISPVSWAMWATENALMVSLALILIFTRKRFPLSNVSYTLIAVYFALHSLGAHYTYSEVPYNQWWASIFGQPLHTGRNHFDRAVHFLFGLLLAYPIRELFLRIARVRGFWGYYLPLDVVLSFSVVYELIEWWYAATFGGGAGHAFLGTQGDEWDAHKDMALAGLGALICMTVVACINKTFHKHFGEEWRQSLTPAEGDTPLGEIRLAELRNNQR